MSPKYQAAFILRAKASEVFSDIAGARFIREKAEILDAYRKLRKAADYVEGQ